jgi:hypothetical protein
MNQSNTGRYVESLHSKVWEELGQDLLYAKFSYNNSYQASIEMAPFESLYRRQCKNLLFWSQMRESQVFGLEVLKDAERAV